MTWVLFLFFTTYQNGAWSAVSDNAFYSQAACVKAGQDASAAAVALQPAIKVKFSCSPHGAA
jgi:hypothetical protein